MCSSSSRLLQFEVNWLIEHCTPLCVVTDLIWVPRLDCIKALVQICTFHRIQYTEKCIFQVNSSIWINFGTVCFTPNCWNEPVKMIDWLSLCLKWQVTNKIAKSANTSHITTYSTKTQTNIPQGCCHVQYTLSSRATDRKHTDKERLKSNHTMFLAPPKQSFSCSCQWGPQSWANLKTRSSLWLLASTELICIQHLLRRWQTVLLYHDIYHSGEYMLIILKVLLQPT
jgi:hypothetical protein